MGMWVPQQTAPPRSHSNASYNSSILSRNLRTLLFNTLSGKDFFYPLTVKFHFSRHLSSIPSIIGKYKNSSRWAQLLGASSWKCTWETTLLRSSRVTHTYRWQGKILQSSRLGIQSVPLPEYQVLGLGVHCSLLDWHSSIKLAIQKNDKPHSDRD